MMKIKRKKNGFTMAEMLIVTAIIAVLGGVIFIMVARYQRSMAHLERDAVAKEIFVAAQNHLTMAQSQGYLGLSEDGFGTPDENETTETEKVYYFNVTRGDLFTSGGRTVLDLMLPFGSVDETVRTGGSYIIRYQAEPAVVLDVFYCSPTGTRFGHDLSAGEYQTVLGLRDAEGASHRSERRNYASGGVLGWYGGEAALEAGAFLKNPQIEVINAEQLVVKVKDPNKDNSAASLKLIITGQKSGAKAALSLEQILTHDRVDYLNTTGEYTIILDDITEEGMHFADLNTDDSIDRKGSFIPGENITVRAVAYSNETLTNIAYSSEKTTNSIFADIREDKAEEGGSGTGEDKTAALIGNFRHLENLDDRVSGVNVTKGSDGETGGEESELAIGYAEQIRDLSAPAEDEGGSGTASGEEEKDLSWGGFTDAIRKAKDNEDGISVYTLDGSVTSAGDSYLPVSPSYTLTYEGQKHSISGVVVKDSGESAGLFGEAKELHVSELALIDFSISAVGEADAGALAGTLSADSTVESVIAYRSEKSGTSADIQTEEGNAGGLVGFINGSSSGSCSITDSGAALYVNSTDGAAGGLAGRAKHTDISGGYAGGYLLSIYDLSREADEGSGASGGGSSDDAPEIDDKISVSGKTSAGGLVGSTEQAVIKESAAAVYVEASEGDAGGLIGIAKDTEISAAYSAGHTKDGEYTENTEGTSSDAVRINVIAKGSAGGLIGDASGNTSVSYSYSTCSSSGEEASGGLIGKANGSNVAASCSYAAGTAFGEEKTGTLLGDGSLKGREEKELKGRYILDIESSALFPEEEDRAEAKTYDETLAETFEGKYIYPTIAQLYALDENSADAPDEDAPAFLTTHYGDWQELVLGPDTDLVIENEETLRAVLSMAAEELEEESFISLLIHGDASGEDALIILSVQQEEGSPDYTVSISEDSEIPGVTAAKLSEWFENVNAVIDVKGSGANKTAALSLTFDDITRDGGHFAQLFTSFIPGEDLSIAVQGGLRSTEDLGKILEDEPEGWTVTDPEDSTKTRTVAARTNSLFADPDASPESAAIDGSRVKDGTAFIENIRHLENLDPSISKLSENDTEHKVQIKKAVQGEDLDWEDFLLKIRKTRGTEDGSGSQGTSSSDDIIIYPAEEGVSPGEKNTFLPVSPDDKLSYEGAHHAVLNIVVKCEGNQDAGLFGSLTSGSSVSDLALKDFHITAENGDAGALCGAASGVTVTNVIAYEAAGETGEVSVEAKRGSAGGLIGSAESCTVEKSAAALIVQSTGGNAGGLIGESEGGSVKGSYAGGHTENGSYSASSYNVTADAGCAGGLVGRAGDTAFESSYSTCSASGRTAGGFVGESEGRISGCYATGLVNGDTEGAFAGTAAGTLTGCLYYETVNERQEGGSITYLGAVGGTSHAGAAALDATAAVYESFCGGPDGWGEAQVYDDVLTDYYGGSYNLKTVSRLEGTGSTVKTTDYVSAHYGDWPAPEIFVINR